MRIALALLATLFFTSTRPPPPDKPNIIYIMVDDLSYGDLGCYGQKVIKTPHIDSLAKEGQRWTHHYAGHTVCRPSRLTLWTGLHSGSTGLTTNMGYRFKPEDVTVAELLKEAGSETARPSAFWDFLPTACELAGVKQFGGIDGISYLPTLFGREQEPRGPLYWAFAGMDAVRDGKWKAVRQIKKSKIEL